MDNTVVVADMQCMLCISSFDTLLSAVISPGTLYNQICFTESAYLPEVGIMRKQMHCTHAAYCMSRSVTAEAQQCIYSTESQGTLSHHYVKHHDMS